MVRSGSDACHSSLVPASLVAENSVGLWGFLNLRLWGPRGSYLRVFPEALKGQPRKGGQAWYPSRPQEAKCRARGDGKGLVSLRAELSLMLRC